MAGINGHRAEGAGPPARRHQQGVGGERSKRPGNLVDRQRPSERRGAADRQPVGGLAPTLTANVDPGWKIALPVTDKVPIVVPNPGATVLPLLATSPATLPVPRSEECWRASRSKRSGCR
jgi:hypothetical protein